jgi:hypothetical protein
MEDQMKKTALLLFTCSVAASCQSASPNSQLLITFAPERGTFTLHEPVFVEMTISNVGSSDSRIDLGKNRKTHVAFDLAGPAGEARGTLRLSESGAGATGVISLPAGEAYRQQILLTEWFPFRESGSYSLVGKVDNGPQAAFRIVIGPRDDAALVQVCIDLATRILGAAGIEQWRLVQALSYIEDPIAVPYMGRVILAEKRFSTPLISALARIGTAAAVEAIILAFDQKEDQDLREFARTTLVGLAERTTDAAIRQRIQDVVK